ncbi:MAG: sugar phosphate isomerase/epimerase [Chloroflexota bacterium]|nr:sugar phosphate isomerase/epimerase [Chloroflexota bacterium]
MRLALSGLLFDHAPATEFSTAAREIGYASVELRGTRHQLPPDADAARLDLLAELLEGLEIANIASHAGNFALLDEAEALEACQTARRFLEWASVLGARSVRIWPGWVAAPEAEPEHWARAARHLRWCAEEAADLGVMVALEMHHGSLIESAAGANRLLDEIDRPAVGLILDPANLLQTPTPFGPRCVGPVWDRLLHVHVKDHSIVGPTEPGAYPFRLYLDHIGSWIERMEPPRRRLGPGWFAKRALGEGHVPWQSILAELKRRGYTGHLIVETEVGPGVPAGRTLAEREFTTMSRWIEAL